MAGDKVSEVYKRRLHSEKTQARLRRRIDWVVSQTQGPTVLDIGCSQGITPILLARKGLRVLGIDPDSESIDYALGDLAEEPAEVQERVEFRVADALTMPLETGIYDTVILGEVIEHLSEPERLIEVAFRALAANGTAVITTPFGVLEHPDHYETYYLSNFLDLVRPFFEIDEMDVIGKRICFVGRRLVQKSTKKPLRSKELERIIELSERHFRLIEDDYLSEIDRIRTNWRIYQERLSQEQKSSATVNSASVEALNKWHEQSQQENDKRFGELLESLREERGRSDEAAKRSLFILMAMEQSRSATETELRDKIRDATIVRRRLNETLAALEAANQKLTDFEAKHSELQKQLVALSDKIEETEKERDQSQEQILASQNEISVLQNENLITQTEKSEIEADRVLLREQYTLLLERETAVAQEVERLQSELSQREEDLREQEVEAERRAGELEQKVTETETRLQTIHDEFLSVVAERDRLLAENSTLSETANKEHARSNVVERQSLASETRAILLHGHLHDVGLSLHSIEATLASWTEELGIHTLPQGEQKNAAAPTNVQTVEERLDELQTLAHEYSKLRELLSTRQIEHLDEVQSLRAEIERLTFENTLLEKRVQIKFKHLRSLMPLPRRLAVAEREVERVYGSVRFRLGSILIEALKPSRATLMLPARLAKLAMEAPQAIAARRQPPATQDDKVTDPKHAQILDKLPQVFAERGPHQAERFVTANLIGPEEFDAKLWNRLSALCEPTDPVRALRYARRSLALHKWPELARKIARLSRLQGHLHLPEKMMRYHLLNKQAPPTPQEILYQRMAIGWTNLLDKEVPVAIERNAEPSPFRKRVLMCLHNSLPHASGGYAIRSHGLLQGLANTRFQVTCCTRLGFPWDLSSYRFSDVKPQFQDRDLIDGVTYNRMPAYGFGHGQIPIDEFLKYYAERIRDVAIDTHASVIHAASNFNNGIAGLAAARALGLPFVYEVRGLWEITRISRDPIWEESEYHQACVRMETEAARGADHVITITNALADELVRRGVDRSRITIVPNGADPERFVPRIRDEELAAELGVSGKSVIGFVGSFTEYEGLDDLLRVARRLKQERDDFRFLLVGDGGEYANVAALRAELGVEDVVILTGRVPFEAVDRYYSLIDIAPFPRKPLPVCEMVSPLKPFEAMSMERAVLVSSVAALAEIVQDGETGLVFEKGNLDNLTDKLRQLLDDSALREVLGRNARRWVCANRMWQHSANAIARIYESLEATTGPQPEIDPVSLPFAPSATGIPIEEFTVLDQLLSEGSIPAARAYIDERRDIGPARLAALWDRFAEQVRPREPRSALEASIAACDLQPSATRIRNIILLSRQVGDFSLPLKMQRLTRGLYPALLEDASLRPADPETAYREGGFAAAESVILRLLKNNPPHDAALWAKMGAFAEESGEAEDAVWFSVRAIELYPSWPALRQIARMLRRLGYLDLPERIMRFFLRIKPTPSESEQEYVRSLSGWADFYRGDFCIPNINRNANHRPETFRVAYCLHSSLPYTSAGYATRAQGILEGLQSRGTDVVAVTRHGFPTDLVKYKAGEEAGTAILESDAINGVVYHRLLSDGTGNGEIPITDYFDIYASRLEAFCRQQGVTVLHAASNFYNGIAGLIAARRLGIPFIYEVRGLWELTRISREPAWERTEYHHACVRMETLAATNADRVVAITPALKDELVARGVSEDRIVVIPNAVNPDRFKPRPYDHTLADQLGLTGHCVIGFVGSFVQYEGLDDLLEVAARLHNDGVDFRLLLVGDGAIHQEIVDQASALGLDSIAVIPGRVPFEDVERYYSLIDIAPFPRKPLPVCELVSPLKPFEAMAMEKAVVVSSVRALQECVVPGRTGLVFEKGNNDSFYAVLRRLIENPRTRSQLGQQGREWVLQERTWNKAAAAFEEIYHSLHETWQIGRLIGESSGSATYSASASPVSGRVPDAAE